VFDTENMRSLLVGVVVVLAGCGPQFPQPDHRPRAAGIPEGRETTATTVPAEAQAVPATGAIRVDHAWVKDASNAAGQAKRRGEIEALRTKVIAGSGFVVAWESLGANGEVWHVAEGETYDAEVLPAVVRGMAPGQVSAVIPGDGGLHLFRVLGSGDGQ
jgi:hypothetical protein